MPAHKHIQTFTEFYTKYEEMKEKWRNMATGTILVARCNYCMAHTGMDHFNSNRAYQAYTTRCSCGHLDRSIMILVPKKFTWPR